MRTKEQTVYKPKLWNLLYIRVGVIAVIFSTVNQMLQSTLSLYMGTLHASSSIIGAMTSSFTIMALLMRLFVGNAIDTKGRRFVGMIGLSFFLVPFIGYMVFPYAIVVFLCRTIQGVGLSCTTVTTGTMAADVPDPERMMEGVGYYGMFNTIGTAFGPAIGLAIAVAFGYRSLFLIGFILIFLDMGMMISMNYEKKRKVKKEILSSETPKQYRGIWRFIEKKALPAATVGFILGLPIGGVVTFMAPYAQSMGIKNIGVFYIAQAVCMFLSRFVSNKMILKGKSKKALFIGLGIMTTGFLMMFFIHNFVILVISGAIYGTGGGFVYPVLAVEAITHAGEVRRGTANSTYLAAYDSGMGLGAMVFGITVDFIGYQPVFLISAILAFADIFVMRILFKRL